jgi:acyl carrier protein
MKPDDKKDMMTRLRIEAIIDDVMQEEGFADYTEADSLSLLNVIFSMEDEWDVSIPVNDMETLVNRPEFVDKVFNVVKATEVLRGI